jgi:hypothetical protein
VDIDDLGSGVTGLPVREVIERFLTAQGVDVDRALADARHAKERQAQRARDRVAAAGDIAFQLRKAKRKLEFEQSGWRANSPGFSLAQVVEARQRVAELDEQLREACVNDPQVIADVKRRAGW